MSDAAVKADRGEDPVSDSWERDPVLAGIGERVRLARLRAEMTQEDLADVLGVTQTAVSYWEAAKRNMGIGDLLRIAEGCGVPASSLLPPEHRESSSTDGDGGYFAEIAFMGRIEYTGLVTQITKHGQPAYHIDLPEKLFGGNPLGWVEHSASAWFSERPRTEASIRRAWEAAVRVAEKRRQQEAEWDRAARQRALAAGEGFGFETGDGDYGDDDE